jgi:hypothetical protein
MVIYLRAFSVPFLRSLFCAGLLYNYLEVARILQALIFITRSHSFFFMGE